MYEEYKELVEKHGGNIQAASQEIGVPHTTFRRRYHKLPGAPAAGTYRKMGTPQPPPSEGLLDLSDRRIATKKPPSTVKARLYSIPRGKGIRIQEAAKEWAVSVETLRRHAKDIDAVCFIEMQPEQWEEIVTYPNAG